MENIVVQTDDENRFSWDSIRSTYIDGTLINVLTEYDDGALKDVSYENGVRAMMFQLDSQIGSGSRHWDAIETYYDQSGSLAGRVTHFDNGIIREDSYDNGVRSMSVQYDNPRSLDGGVRAWETVATYYDNAGLIVLRATMFDNGTVKEELFANGVRSLTVQTDYAPYGGTGAKSWDRIETHYDTAGDLAARITFFDNGVVREEQFSAGVKARTLLTDNSKEYGLEDAKPWSTYESFYDDAGVIVAREIIFDDGRLRQDTYENGVLATTEIQDGAFGSASQNAWTAINMYYDENGKIAQKYTLFDDGRVRQDEYTDGVRVQSLIEDKFLMGAGKYDWDTMVFSYDANGKVEHKATAYDDGDLIAQSYVDGVRTSRSEYDGDNSEAWLGRLTTYNTDGSVAGVETFADYAELPEDFIGGPDLYYTYSLG